jgi:hypothetical protein
MWYDETLAINVEATSPAPRVVEDVFAVHHIVEMVLEDEDPIDLPNATSHALVEVSKCAEKACCVVFFLNVMLSVAVIMLSLDSCQFNSNSRGAS